MKKIALALLFLGTVALADEGIRVVSWPVAPTSATKAIISTTSVSNVAVTLLAARSGRLRVVLFNEKETIYIKAGTGATINDYT